MTHAKNRFIRRIENRNYPNGHSSFGLPISGALTDAEIAHKARRRSRRIEKCNRDMKELPSLIYSLESKIDSKPVSGRNEWERIQRTLDSVKLQQWKNQLIEAQEKLAKLA